MNRETAVIDSMDAFIKVHFAFLVCLLMLFGLWLCLLSVLSRKNHRFKQVLIVCTELATGIYLLWRLIFTLVPFTTGLFVSAFSILLLLAELFGYTQSSIFYFLFWHPLQERQISLWPSNIPWPTIDVFVTTYDEPLNVLRRTLVACTKLDYDKSLLKIYVCDDGRRLEVARLAKSLKLGYLSRPDNKDAKAGNLNYALSHSRGQLIATLDADMVPKSWFLKTLVGFFYDEKMGFVQAPQAFFNSDPFHFNLFSHLEMPNEQDFFMRDIQMARDAHNAVMYVGSNAIFSRKALQEIGGFAKGSITEDVATGMLIQAKGYKTAFIKQVLAKGLAPESWGELAKQRTRWCRGNIQAGRLWNPLTVHGLSPVQRVLYLNGIMYWYFGVQKLIYILAPLLFLTFGTPILIANWRSLLLFWGAHFVASLISFRVIGGRRRTSLWSHIYETALAPQLAWAAIKETMGLRQSRFQVTQKGLTSAKRTFHWPSGIFHLVFFLLTLAGVLSALRCTVWGSFPIKTFGFVLFWATYNCLALATAILIVFDRPRQRLTERFPLKLPVEIITSFGQVYRGVTIDLSETGIRAKLSGRAVLTSRVKIHLHSGKSTENSNYDIP